jgi:hypothetical protein
VGLRQLEAQRSAKPSWQPVDVDILVGGFDYFKPEPCATSLPLVLDKGSEKPQLKTIERLELETSGDVFVEEGEITIRAYYCVVCSR